MKRSIFIFLLGILASGLIFAEEGGAFSSRTSTATRAGFDLDMIKYGIHERIADSLGLFDASENGQSARYNVELNVENEDSDWSFEVTVTVEF